MKDIVTKTLREDELGFMGFHIGEAGNVGKDPSDRDCHPDTGFSDICGQEIGQSHADSE